MRTISLLLLEGAFLLACGCHAPDRRSSRFKVTSAKPAEVEAALRSGWTLVNCSLATYPGDAGSTSTTYSMEHCYLVGDERSDAGSPEN
jgi:hypothetical protein